MNRKKLLQSQKEASVVTTKRNSFYPKASIGSVVNIVKCTKSAPAVTLVEIMVTIIILLVAILGACSYRYYAALDARRADVYITAARLGSLLCENWKGVQGDYAYNVTDDLLEDLVIETVYEGPDVPADVGILGYYKIAVKGVNYHTVLWWKPVSSYSDLRELHVIVAWNWRNPESWYWNKSFRVTNYTPI